MPVRGRAQASVDVLELSSAEIERLELRATGAKDLVTRRRAAIVLDSARGRSAAAIANAARIDAAEVHAVVREFNRRGFDSLRPRPAGDDKRPRRADRRRRLRAAVDKRAPGSGRRGRRKAAESPRHEPGRSRWKSSSRAAAAATLALVLTLPAAAALRGAATRPAAETETADTRGADASAKKVAPDELEAMEVGAGAGVRFVSHTWGAAAGDFDGDGWDDLVIGSHYDGPARLYRNVEGRFERIAPESFPADQRDRHDCDWGDVNGDDALDAYCSIGGGKGHKLKPNELWVQQPDGSFSNEADEYGVSDRTGRGRDVVFADVNGDDFVDLFVGNDFPRYDGRRSQNQLFINEGGAGFRRAPEYGVSEAVGGEVVEAADYDADGWTDLAVCGSEGVFLYRNVGGRRFEDVSRAERVGRSCRAIVLAQFDGREGLDLARITRHRLIVKLQARNGRFGRPVLHRRLRNGGDLAVGEVNGDQRADLYVLQGGPVDEDRPDLLLVNRGDGRGFTRIPMPQTRRGVGDAVVEIDHDRNGRSDFLVLNGKNKGRAPTRLIALR